MQFLRLNSGTGAGSGPTISIGPALDSAGAEYTGLVIGDLTLVKNGTSAAMAANATLTHTSNGHYDLVMIGNNADTLGRLKIRCNKATYQIPPQEFMVLPATVYDALVTNATTDAGGLGDVQRIRGSDQSMIDLKDFADDGYDPSTNKVQGVVLTDTVTTYTGNTPQTGDSYAIVNSGTHGNAAIKGYVDDIGVAGAGLTALGDTRLANLDALVSSRMATYTQPTGFLTTTFPGGTVASTTNITAGTMTTTTNVTNGVTLADGVSHGGTTATLSLKSIVVSNPVGNAVTLECTNPGGDNHGIYVVGTGSGDGVHIIGGATGHGLHLQGGGTSGDGLHARATGTGDGIQADGNGVGGVDIRGNLTGILESTDAIPAAAVAAAAVTKIQNGLATAASVTALGSPMQAGSTVVLTDASLTTAKLGAFALAKTTNITGFNDPTATENADALLKRDMSAVTGEAARSPLNALRFLRNLWTIVGTTLTVKKEDDSTTAWTATVTTNASADPVTGSDPA